MGLKRSTTSYHPLVRNVMDKMDFAESDEREKAMKMKYRFCLDPETGEAHVWRHRVAENEENTEIQIKWQDYGELSLGAYHCGDLLEYIDPEFNNTWIRTDFICNVCSKWVDSKTAGKFIPGYLFDIGF